MVSFTAGQTCGCLRCDLDVDRVIDVADKQRDRLPDSRMYLCPECCDKRCGRAYEHRMPCDKTRGRSAGWKPVWVSSTGRGRAGESR